MNFATKQKSNETSRVVQRMNNMDEDVQAKEGREHPNIDIQKNRNAVQRSSENDEDSIQTKLAIGSPNDKFEQEADKTAERVMSRPAPVITASNITEEEVFGSRDESINKQDFLQTVMFDEKPQPSNQKNDHLQMSRFIEENTTKAKPDSRAAIPMGDFIQTLLAPEPKPAPAKTQEEKKEIQKMADEPVQAKGNARMAKIEEKLVASRSGGAPMSDALLMEMQARFGGVDFSSVKIHTDSDAISMCKQLNARAFTNGKHIYFNAGQFNPATAEGKLLLAHELTHTIHQGATSNKVQREEDSDNVQLQEMDSDRGSDEMIQTKIDEYIHHEDGDGVAGRMDDKFVEEGSEDADPDEEVPEIDPAERREKKGEIKSEGIAKPSVDRPAKELPSVKTAAKEGKEKQDEKPETEEKGEKEEEPPRADLTGVEAREANALVALEQAQGMKMPKKPKPLKAPKIQKPKDSKNQPLPVNAGNDKAVRALHEIAVLFVEQAYGLKEEAFHDAKVGKSMQAKVHESHAKIETAAAASKLMNEDNVARDSINVKEEEALAKVEKDTAFVKEKAPDLISKSKEGQDKSGPMVEDSKKQQKETEANQPDDAEAAGDSKKQAEESAEVSKGSGSMDDAFTGTGDRSAQYLQDAVEGEQKNQQTKDTLDANKETSELTKAEIARIDEHNLMSQEQMLMYDAYPAQIEQETNTRAASGEELYRAAVVMNDQLIDTQNEYYKAMSALESKEDAQKKKDDEEKAKQASGGEGEQKVLTPEEEMLITMSEMGEQEMEVMMMGMEESEIVGLQSTLDGMETQEEEGEEEKNPMLTDPDAAGRQKVDLMKMFDDPNKEPEGPPDPRQEKMDAIEGRRSERIGQVKKISDDNYAYLTGAQKAMLAQKLAASDAVSGLFDMDILEVGKGMIMGMINPLESLKGIVDGASKMASGIVNLFSAEAWAKDPLGNLLQSSADIATGLTMIFMSITGLATAMTIITGVLIVLSWFTLAAPMAPFLSFLTSVISTVGGWTVVTGLIALELNYLTYIKNLNDASVSTNTDELLFESDSLKQNMTDGFTSAMAVVGGKGDKAGAKALQKNILKGGGAKKFYANKGDVFKQGLKKTGGNIGKFVKGGVVKGTKQLAKQGAKRLKSGFKNTLKRIKEGAKNAPGNLKNKLNNKWKAFKEGFSSPKKPKSIDTPHGKLTKAPEGGSLGDFNGQKVKAEMDFPDGHKAKSLDNGKCAVCSNCAEINKKFGKQLDKPENAKLSQDLKDLEAKIAGPPKPSDTELGDLVAQQKKLHDNLETQLYKDTVPNGKLTDKQIQDKLDANKKFNPDTKRFGNPKKPPKGNPIDNVDFDNLGSVKVCFPAGTLVDTQHGTKNIESICVGDMIHSYNQSRSKTEVKMVTSLFTTNTDILVRIELSNGEIIRSTPKHRFWETNSSEWVQAGLLQKGMNMFDIQNTSIEILSVSTEKQSVETYNFEVEGNHNYFVGEASILVHNASSYLNPEKTAIEFYQIVNGAGEVIYVGQTQSNVGVDERFKQHIREGKKKGGWKKDLNPIDFEIKLVDPPGSGVEMTQFQARLTEQKLINEHGNLEKNGGSLKNDINAMDKKKYDMVKKKAQSDPDLFKKLYDPNMC